MVDVTELLSEQPLIDEGSDSDEGNGAQLEQIGGSDYGSDGEPPEAEGDGEEHEPERKHVPLSALHQERARRQALETEAQQLRQAQATTLERMTKLLEAQQQAQQPQQQQHQEEVIPDFVDDPEGAFKALQRQHQQAIKQFQDYLAGNQQQSQAQQQHAQLTQTVSQQEAEYTATVPDYPQAADYFYQRKVAEYEAFTGNRAVAQQQVANDYNGIARLAQQQNKNAAELMYNAAKAMGYKPGGTPQNTQTRREPPTSLSTLQGSPRAPDEQGKVTAQDISQMSEKEFDDYWRSMSRGNGPTRPKV